MSRPGTTPRSLGPAHPGPPQASADSGRRRLRFRIEALLLTLLVLATLATTVAKAKRSSRNPPSAAAAGAPRGYRSLLHQVGLGDEPLIRDLTRRSALDAAGANIESHIDFRVLYPAGDLDGDQLGDAFEVSDQKMTAVRGTDGATLWTRTFMGWGFPVARSQLDGSGGLDVLLFEEDWSSTEAGYRMTVRLSALAGGSGAELWTRTFEGNGSEGSIGGYGYGGGGGLGASAEATFPVLAGVGDTTGDGRTDLLIGQYSYISASDQDSTSATFSVISGADGSLGPAFAAAGRFGWPDAVLVPDLSGDGHADVVTLSSFRLTGQDPAADTRLAAFPGIGGPPVWQASVTVEGYAFMQGLRLDGDARADLLLTIDHEATRLVALSGLSGATLWSRDLEQYAWYFPIGAGDIGGDGGQEVLVLTAGGFFFFSAGAAPATSTLGIPTLPGHTEASDPCYGCEPCDPDPCPPPQATMLRGADGAVLWEVPVPDDEYHTPAGDVTGDGIQDVLMVGPGTGSNNVAGRLISGRTGTQVWTRASTWDDLYPLFGDLDADGAQDLILLDYRSAGDRYVAVRGTTGQNLWTANRSPGGSLIVTIPGALGTDGADVLETAFGSSDIRIAAVNGTNGAQLWRRS
ncbi:MAG TPA: hypothetical protein VGB28_02165 [Actinomycetota bacterium]